MNIRLAKKQDLDKIMEIYENAKIYMRSNGNKNQWNNNYPNINLLQEDIASNHLFVVEDDNDIYGVFAFILGKDSTYNYIEDGEWLNDEHYGTIHRIASNGIKRGIMKLAVTYCKEKISNLRIDTHSDNKIMQKLILENDFKYCGIIYLENGDPRLAYQWTNITNEGNNIF